MASHMLKTAMRGSVKAAFSSSTRRAFSSTKHNAQLSATGAMSSATVPGRHATMSAPGFRSRAGQSVLDQHMGAAPELRRQFHTSHAPQNVALVIGVSVGAAALVARYAVQAYPEWSAKRERTQAAFRSPYKGGFDEEMSRREASLILGVRESASKDRIKKRHRDLLMKNHPDKGGSTYMATKVNEAKDKLLGGGAS